MTASSKQRGNLELKSLPTYAYNRLTIAINFKLLYVSKSLIELKTIYTNLCYYLYIFLSNL